MDLDATAKALGRHLVISFGWHYRPTVIEAKRIMTEDGGVGRSSTSSWRWRPAPGTAEGHRRLRGLGVRLHARLGHVDGPAMSGGGYGPAQLSHAMGLALWLSGERARTCSRS